MAATVFLIRHPESAWNRRGIYQGQKDIPLSPLGRRQADLVASRLRDERLTGVISSPLGRAHALADAIAGHHDLEVQVDPRLTEISHGLWEGLSRHDVKLRWPELYRVWVEHPHEVSFPDGESLWDVHRRCLEPVQELLSLPASETWVVVTHDTCARLIIAAALGRPMSGFATLALENAAITTLVGPALEGAVRNVNDVVHLGEHRVDLEGQAL